MRGSLKFLVLFILLLVLVLGLGFSQNSNKPAQVKSRKPSSVIPSKMSHRKRKDLLKLKDKYEIKLRSRRFTPVEDISSAIQSHIRPSTGNRVHVLMQLTDIPDASRRLILEAAGVKLLRYIPNKAWLVSVPRGITEAELTPARVRWLGKIRPEDKIFPEILKRGVGSWAHNSDGSVNLEVSFFKDVPLTEAWSLINTIGAAVKEESKVSHRLTVTVSPDDVMNIAGNDIVRWVIEERPPKKELNDGSRANVNANAVQVAPYNLNGSDVDVGIWDGADVDATHGDFGNRVTVVDNAGNGDHATHVAGTVGGDGTLSASNGGATYQWKGMAPAVDIISYLWDNNITDHDQAINTYGIELSQNSWGYDLVGPPAQPEYYGYYGWGAPEYDDIVTGLYGKRISVVFSAGNDRDVAGDYDCIGPPSTAKNIICVGAINSDDNSMAYFSSWGPMDDGRIKPDIVAPGDEVSGDGGIKSTFPGDNYGVYVGTSMSAPCVSGCVALIIEDFYNIYTADPLPSTVKGLLIHEAQDLGNTGPDYSFGYGDVNIKNSIDKLRAQSLVEGTVSVGEYNTYTLSVSSLADEVKITLVWDDEPATEAAAKTLVNDLDLIVKDPDGVRHYPWTLDPGNPSNPAVRTQVDTKNNVEQVEVNTSIVSGTWTVQVYGNDVPYGPQDYSLIFTPDLGVAIGKIYEDSEYSQEELFFDRTDMVYIEFYVALGGLPVTGATVTADLSLSDGTPVTTIGLIEQGEAGYYRNGWNSTGATPDVYTVEITFEELTTKEYFHLYPQSGVSAYMFDYNNDESDDYVLENKHLIAVYNGRSDWNKTLLYLRQKDTDTSFTFADISDGNTIGRGEATTGNMKDISFSSFSFSQQGENLANTELYITENLSELVYPSTLNILIINDDDGSGDNSADRFNFVLNNLGHTTTLESSASTNSSTWTNYDILVWASSDDESPINGGNTATRDALINYVNNGGRLVIEGGQIGYIATNNNWSSFLSNVLHIPDLWYGNGKGLGNVELEVFTGSHPLRTIPNTLPDPLYINPGSTGSDYGSADGIEALSDAVMIYRWNSYVGEVTQNAVGGLVAYDDDPAVEGGQIVYMSFDLLQIDNSNDEAYLIENAVEWVRPPEIVSTIFDLSIEMKSEQADYLVYLLSNFDDNIDDVLDIFAPVSGFLGSSVDDDIYHIGDGSEDLVTSLSSGTWTNFNSLYDEEKYVAIYDDPSGGDDMNNLISWIYFPNAGTVSFQDVGCWYETGTGALRIRYNTTSATAANEAEYILAFTQGDHTVIDQWMSNIAAGVYPAPNFMTAPSALSVSVNPQAWPIGVIQASQIIQSTELDKITVTNDGSFNETFTLNISSSVPTWFPGLSTAEDTYVLWGLFCGATDSPVSNLFQSEDIIIFGPPELATATKFGDISLSDNGVDVIPSASVNLWFQFQAPTSTTDNREQAITVTVGVEQAQ